MILEELKQLVSEKDPLERITIMKSLSEIFEAFEAKITNEYDAGVTTLEQLNKITESMHIRELIHLTHDQILVLDKKPNAKLEGYWQKLNELLAVVKNK